MELHTLIEPLGKTIFHVNGEVAHLEKFPNIDYTLPKADTFTPQLLFQCEFLLEELSRIVSNSDYHKNNLWQGCILTQLTHEFRQQFSVDSDKLTNAIAEGVNLYSEVNASLDINLDWSCNSVIEIENIYEVTKISPRIPHSWISLDLCSIASDLAKCIEAVELQDKINSLIIIINGLNNDIEISKHNFEETLMKLKSAQADLLSSNDENILQIDADIMLGLYRNEYRTWLRGFISGYRKAQKQLLAYQKTANKFSYAEGLMLLDKVATVKTLKLDCENHSKELENLNELLAKKQQERDSTETDLLNLQHENTRETLESHLGTIVEPSNYVELKSKLEWTQNFQDLVHKYNLGNNFVVSACNAEKETLSHLSDNIAKIKVWQIKITPMLDKFTNLFDAERKQAFNNFALQILSDQINACKNNFTSLEHLIDFKNVEKKLTELGLSAYLEKAKEINLDAKNLVPVFKKCFYRSWLDSICPKFETINEFRRLRQDEKIALFKELDMSHMEISKAMLISKLVSTLPNFDAFNSNSEVALLRREMAKQRKLMPTRKLIAALPNLLPTLKPCIMMSPLSVSTYLGDSAFEFDAVIFDEASQVRTEEAIGAIFRAKNTIIAGDSKQLPPTDFFSTSMSSHDEYTENEEGETDDTGAYESLLDEAIMLPTQTLLWHYRSRHEHLIAFSNQKIYNGNLTTFPSSVEKIKGMGVEYVHVVGGIYDRGGRNGNKAEAKCVAELTLEHFSQYPNRSLGIIAFGEVQQSAITDALIEKRRANPTFENFFKENKEESLFIKNLETVQGDERDTIIFSIGYAPDVAGKFIMNFGPLSRNGGERRLNVAVTRARYNLKLVGSILPTDIDVERTSGQGPKLLRLYIDFAINGAVAILGEKVASEGLWFDSPFETSVYNFLTENGFDVATQVGCSGYRIDMAVRHPKYNGRYAIGIECDGAMYHSARTARERDRLRQTVLEDMGWKIYRIWSTDWIKDRFIEQQRLMEAVKNAINDYHESTPLQQNEKTEKMSDFLNVTTISEWESAWQGKRQKQEVLRSRYYGLSANDIPTRDFVETMFKVLQNSFGLNKVGLFKETALYGYGWERQGSNIKANFERAYKILLKDGNVEEVDEKLKVKENAQ